LRGRPNGWAQTKGQAGCWLTRNRITRDIIKTDDESIERIQRQATIDLRIDYFSPGRGERFTVKGQPLKVGSRSISTRMEMFNDQGEMIAAGSANFIY
jgi:acyl-coenzyme A thioesterase PaaI-like protein